MRLIILIILLGLVGLNVSAETTWVDDAVKAELKEETGARKDQKGSHNIYIVNKNDSEAKARNLNNGELTAQQKAIAEAQNQPETVVEASPLVESYATNLRKMRENAELETEQKIVEKLESARLEDERKRAQRLFGNKKFETPHAQAEEVITCEGQGCWVPVEQAPVQIIERVAPVKTVEVIEKVKAPSPVIVPAINYEARPKTKMKDVLSRSYVTTAIGGVGYRAENVESKFAYQLGVGVDLSERGSVEASFAYSQHRVDEFFGSSHSRTGSFGFTDLDQYNWGVEGKYNVIAHSKFNLYAGAHLGVVFRNYFGVNTGRGYHGKVGSESEENTRAINFAPVISAEFNLSESLTLGVDYKYMKNMAQKFSSEDMKHSFRDSLSKYDYEPLENIDYSVLSVKAKLRF